MTSDASDPVAAPASADDHRLAVLKIAKALAPGWERQRARIETGVAPVRRWLLQELAPEPGDVLLELAAGVGDSGFEALVAAGADARLISTDVSAEMVEVARRRGAELELANVDYRVMDAERIDLDADSVDGVICRFGYMLMADPEAALSKTRRVLRGGRRLVLSVWGGAEQNPWVTRLAAALVELGRIPPPEPGGPDPFSMCNADDTKGRLERAGFETVRTAEVPVRFDFADVDDYVSYAADTAGPFATVLAGQSDEEAAELKDRLREDFAPFAAEGGYQLPGLALNAVAA